MSLKKAQEACRTQARAECVANDDHPDICTDLTGPRYFDTCMRERGYELHSRRVRACQGMKFF